MRHGAITLGIVAALVGTSVLAYVALRPPRAVATPTGPGGAPLRGTTGPRGGAARIIRPFQTTLTLAEDLRDALARDPDHLARECWRVSAALRRNARYTLSRVAPAESSPRVRALLVLAAGIHLPDDPALLDLLGDAEPVVRRAAVLATGYARQGRAHPLFDRLDVPVGLPTSDEALLALDELQQAEEDEGVRGAIAAVLRPVNSPR